MISGVNPLGAPDQMPEEAPWVRYRCPVCGHRDKVDAVRAGLGAFDCTHCTAFLEVRGSLDAGESVEVRLSSGGPPH